MSFAALLGPVWSLSRSLPARPPAHHPHPHRRRSRRPRRRRRCCFVAVTVVVVALVSFLLMLILYCVSQRVPACLPACLAGRPSGWLARFLAHSFVLEQQAAALLVLSRWDRVVK